MHISSFSFSCLSFVYHIEHTFSVVIRKIIEIADICLSQFIPLDYWGNYRFSIKELESLKALTKHYLATKENKYLPDQTLIEEFIYTCIGNVKILNKIYKISKLPEWKINRFVKTYGLDRGVIYHMSGLCQKTVFHQHISSIGKKFKPLVKKIKNKRFQEISEHEKMSRPEYRILHECVRSIAHLEFFLKEPITYYPLQEYFMEVSRIREKYRKLKDIFIEYLISSHHYKSGDIFTYFSSKNMELSPPLSFWDWILTKLKDQLITLREHTSKIICTKESSKLSIKQSHLVPGKGHKFNQFRIRDEACCEVWRVNPNCLLKKEGKAFQILSELHRKKGINTKRRVKKLYQKAERRIHENTKLCDLKFDRFKAFLSAIMDFGWRGGHKKKTKTFYDFFKLHRQFTGGFGSEKSNRMFCSEFVVKATIAALVELDKMLQQEIDSVIPAESFDSEMPFIKIPFDRGEKVNYVHPGRMIRLLQDAQCVEKIKPSILIQSLFSGSRDLVVVRV